MTKTRGYSATWATRRNSITGGATADSFDEAADDVADGDVGFLDALGVVRWDVDEEVHAREEFAACLAGHSDDEGAARAARVGATKNIGALPACGNGDNDVSFRNERLDLAGENSLKAEVVSGSGEDRGVRREGQRGQAWAIIVE